MMNINNPQDLQRKREETASVGYQRFMLLVGRNTMGLFCFFEGNADKDYYIPRIKRYISSYEIIPCKGKSKVLEVRKLVQYHREYDKYRKAFFIDRDFDPLINLSDVYETPYYSIENFYVSVPVFQQILIHHCFLSKSDEEYAIYSQLYSDRQKEFHEAILLLNAWYACLIDRRNSKLEPEITDIKAKLSEKLPKNYISISLEKTTQNYNINTIKTEFPHAITFDNEKLTEKIAQFEAAIHHQVFRGKYELLFLKAFLIELKKNEKININRHLENIDIDEFIFHYADLAETPDCLHAYLQQFTEHSET